MDLIRAGKAPWRRRLFATLGLLLAGGMLAAVVSSPPNVERPLASPAAKPTPATAGPSTEAAPSPLRPQRPTLSRTDLGRAASAATWKRKGDVTEEELRALKVGPKMIERFRSLEQDLEALASGTEGSPAAQRKAGRAGR